MKPCTLYCAAGSIRISGDGQMLFRYKPQPGIYCEFHLLSECGEAWRRGFKAALDNVGLFADTRELDHAPWLASFAVELGKKPDTRLFHRT